MISKALKSQKGFAALPLVILVAALAGIFTGTLAVQRGTRTQSQATLFPYPIDACGTVENDNRASVGSFSATTAGGDNYKFDVTLTHSGNPITDPDGNVIKTVAGYRIQFRTEKYPAGRPIKNPGDTDNFYDTTSKSLIKTITDSGLTEGLNQTPPDTDVFAIVRTIYEDSSGNQCSTDFQWKETNISDPTSPTATPTPTPTPTTTVTTTPSPTPTDCDSTKPNHMCGTGNLTVSAYVEKEQNKCDGFFKSGVDVRINAAKDAPSHFEFTNFKGDPPEKKDMTSGGSVKFDQIWYVPNSPDYNNLAQIVYKYPDWVLSRETKIGITPCENIRVGGKTARHDSSARTLTLDIAGSDFGSLDSLSVPFRFRSSLEIPTTSPSPTPTLTPTPTTEPGQCPAVPDPTVREQLTNCTANRPQPNNIQLDLANWPNSAKVTWDKIMSNAVIVYRVALFYSVKQDNTERGMLAGWEPNIIQESSNTTERTIQQSEFNSNGVDGPFEHIKTAVASGAEVKIWAGVRAVYGVDYPDCFCRTHPITESTPIDVPGGPTPTPTVAYDCSQCVGDTVRRYGRDIWDVGGNDDDGIPATPNNQVDNCKEACLAFWGPECTGIRQCSRNPNLPNPRTDHRQCCECQTNTGASCETLPTPTSGAGGPPPPAATNTPIPAGGATSTPTLRPGESPTPTPSPTPTATPAPQSPDCTALGGICVEGASYCTNIIEGTNRGTQDCSANFPNLPVCCELPPTPTATPTTTQPPTGEASIVSGTVTVHNLEIPHDGIFVQVETTSRVKIENNSPIAGAIAAQSEDLAPQLGNAGSATTNYEISLTPSSSYNYKARLIAYKPNGVDTLAMTGSKACSSFPCQQNFTLTLPEPTQTAKLTLGGRISNNTSRRLAITGKICAPGPNTDLKTCKNVATLNYDPSGTILPLDKNKFIRILTAQDALTIGEKYKVAVLVGDGNKLVYWYKPQEITISEEDQYISLKDYTFTTTSTDSDAVGGQVQTAQDRTDVDGNKFVNALDYDLTVRKYGETCDAAGTLPAEDVNFDCRVNGVDLSWIISTIGPVGSAPASVQQSPAGTGVRLIPTATPPPQQSLLRRLFFFL